MFTTKYFVFNRSTRIRITSSEFPQFGKFILKQIDRNPYCVAKDGYIFVNTNVRFFRILLEICRNGQGMVPNEDKLRRSLIFEARYYSLPGIERTIQDKIDERAEIRKKFAKTKKTDWYIGLDGDFVQTKIDLEAIFRYDSVFQKTLLETYCVFPLGPFFLHLDVSASHVNQLVMFMEAPEKAVWPTDLEELKALKRTAKLVCLPKMVNQCGSLISGKIKKKSRKTQGKGVADPSAGANTDGDQEGSFDKQTPMSSPAPSTHIDSPTNKSIVEDPNEDVSADGIALEEEQNTDHPGRRSPVAEKEFNVLDLENSDARERKEIREAMNYLIEEVVENEEAPTTVADNFDGPHMDHPGRHSPVAGNDFNVLDLEDIQIVPAPVSQKVQQVLSFLAVRNGPSRGAPQAFSDIADDETDSVSTDDTQSMDPTDEDVSMDSTQQTSKSSSPPSTRINSPTNGSIVGDPNEDVSADGIALDMDHPGRHSPVAGNDFNVLDVEDIQIEQVRDGGGYASPLHDQNYNNEENELSDGEQNVMLYQSPRPSNFRKRIYNRNKAGPSKKKPKGNGNVVNLRLEFNEEAIEKRGEFFQRIEQQKKNGQVKFPNLGDDEVIFDWMTAQLDIVEKPKSSEAAEDDDDQDVPQ